MSPVSSSRYMRTVSVLIPISSSTSIVQSVAQKILRHHVCVYILDKGHQSSDALAKAIFFLKVLSRQVASNFE